MSLPGDDQQLLALERQRSSAPGGHRPQRRRLAVEVPGVGVGGCRHQHGALRAPWRGRLECSSRHGEARNPTYPHARRSHLVPGARGGVQRPHGVPHSLQRLSQGRRSLGRGPSARGQGQGRARCSLRALRLRGQLQRCWLCHGVARRHCRLHRRARHLARRRRLWHHRRVQWDGRQAGGDGLAAGAMLGKGFLRSMGLLQRGKQHPGLPGAGGGRRRERLRWADGRAGRWEAQRAP